MNYLVLFHIFIELFGLNESIKSVIFLNCAQQTGSSKILH